MGVLYGFSDILPRKKYITAKKLPPREGREQEPDLYVFTYPTGPGGAGTGGVTGKRAGRDPKRVISTAPRPARAMTTGASQPTQGIINWTPSATRANRKVP